METIKIAIVGLGYVGLPLACLFATKYPVVGFDVKATRIKALKAGKDETGEVPDETLNELLLDAIPDAGNRGVYFTSSIEELAGCNY